MQISYRVNEHIDHGDNINSTTDYCTLIVIKVLIILIIIGQVTYILIHRILMIKINIFFMIMTALVNITLVKNLLKNLKHLMTIFQF